MGKTEKLQNTYISATGPIMELIRIPPSCTEIEYKGLRCLITERPSSVQMLKYLEELRRYGVSVLVRVCEYNYYDTAFLQQNGINVVDLYLNYGDGQGPPQKVLDAWLDLLRSSIAINPKSAVAIHCLSGLGRAPVLVALALVELGMKWKDAIALIRAKRPGAINTKQAVFIERYKPKGRLLQAPKGSRVLGSIRIRRKSSIFI